jgi:hypothetical protein
MRILSMFLLFAAGCAVNLGSAEGIVVDSATGKGLSGAFVVSAWYARGADMVGSRTSCVDVAVVQADAGGRYRLPPAPVGLGIEGEVFAYVPGYEADRTGRYDETRIAQRAFKGSGEARIKGLEKFGYLRSCGPGSEMPSKLRSLYQAIDQEVNKLQFAGRPPDALPDIFIKALRASTPERTESGRKP